jgi:cytochrome c biogenesis protein ResB
MDFDVWLPQPIEIANNPKAPWKFQATELKMGHFTGLAVSYEPGKWEIRFGIALLVFGLISTFYLVHIRIWVVSVRGPGLGARTLWIGGSTNRDRNGFEVRFNDLAASIESELKPISRSVVTV